MNTLNEKQQDANLAIKTPWGVRISRLIIGDATKNSLSKVKASMIAIILGLIFGIIPILIAKGNPILGYLLMFYGPLTATAFRRTIAIVSVFIILGAGIGVSFRTGLFNIGATGQFLMAGMICTLFGINDAFNQMFGKSGSLIILLILSMVVGALSASIPGILKAFFNVHEVVSTILLNWVIFFVVRWMVSLEGIRSDDGTATKSLLPNSQFSLAANSNDFILLITIAIIMAILLFVVFKFTNFGLRLRINGLNESAAKYSGINTKSNIIYAMMISGAFAGLAGFIFYSSIEKAIPKLDTLPTIGFEALTVALLAFSSPLGSILSGFFYGLLYQGKDFMQIGAGGNVVKETAALTLGIIIFMSALAVIFVRVYPIKRLTKWYYLIRFKQFKVLRTNKATEKSMLKSQMALLCSQARVNANSKKIALKALRHDSISQINAINDLYRLKKIDILTKETQLNALNNEFQAKVEAEKLNELSALKQNNKIALRELTKKYRFLVNKTLLDYGAIQEQLKEEKFEKMHSLLLNTTLTKGLKDEYKKAIKHNYKTQKSALIKKWKLA